MSPPLLRRSIFTAVLTVPLGFRPAAAQSFHADSQPAPPGQTSASSLTILYCGDSLAQGLYLSTLPPLRRRPEVRVMNGTRHATGITRGDEFDWVSAVRDNVARTRPDLMVAWIGANDFRPYVDRAARQRFAFGTPGYVDAYAARMQAMTQEATARGALVAWIGLPNMREGTIAHMARQLNDIQEQAARSAGALWIPSWDATSDPAGHFRPSLPAADRTERRFRADDGVHFSDLGYRTIARLAFGSIAAERPDLAPPLTAATTALEA